jgi:hypothetical protein
MLYLKIKEKEQFMNDIKTSLEEVKANKTKPLKKTATNFYVGNGRDGAA